MVTSGTNITSYTYNGDGLRVSKTVNGTLTNYLYEFDKVVSEYDSSNNQTAKDVYGTNLLARTVAGQTYYYMYNGHADATALLNVTGNVDATYYYDAFGNIVSQTGTVNNSITYAGYQYEKETKLYYCNARMYDPLTARFLQEDTYTGDPNDPLSLNLYTYCHNEPVMYSDPTGHFRDWREAAAFSKRMDEEGLNHATLSLEQGKKKAKLYNQYHDEMYNVVGKKYYQARQGNLGLESLATSSSNYYGSLNGSKSFHEDDGRYWYNDPSLKMNWKPGISDKYISDSYSESMDLEEMLLQNPSIQGNDYIRQILEDSIDSRTPISPNMAMQLQSYFNDSDCYNQFVWGQEVNSRISQTKEGIISLGEGFYEAAKGKTLITGQKVGPVQRVISGAMAVLDLGVVGKLGKLAKEGKQLKEVEKLTRELDAGVGNGGKPKTLKKHLSRCIFGGKKLSGYNYIQIRLDTRMPISNRSNFCIGMFKRWCLCYVTQSIRCASIWVVIKINLHKLISDEY